ncbi:probable Cytochrome oxidase assembly factor 4 [Saccharomycodes ludwigii]|uniref:Probable Cytochrome oxidase assembly factor 4 n=1 Tax=Saccharomycodes ludwigii TaxID=36035 RepID=A0A376B3L5_9ASCO|nr:hypothetical protein SCDLUD_000273 [Saccharomycodes ludwigii]KAH3902689.1 hypothetical protein SCDLUD_000273 [Saccharomycodes ludwigii]SSD59257.1 probable Cytochrome oxidase assembly factor 4 [Saccharomycodes ludwigii]
MSDSQYYKQASEIYQDLREDAEQDADNIEVWDKRIDNTGCYVENMALQLCHAETNDWRQCLNEMKLFKDCWESHGNRERIGTVDKNQTDIKN